MQTVHFTTWLMRNGRISVNMRAEVDPATRLVTWPDKARYQDLDLMPEEAARFTEAALEAAAWGDVPETRSMETRKNHFPYVISVWTGYHRDVAMFRGFDLALSCFRHLDDCTKQLVNRDRAELGRDGLTDEEKEQLHE